MSHKNSHETSEIPSKPPLEKQILCSLGSFVAWIFFVIASIKLLAYGNIVAHMFQNDPTAIEWPFGGNASLLSTGYIIGMFWAWYHLKDLWKLNKK